MPDDFDTVIREVDAECRRQTIPMLGPHKSARLCELINTARPELVVEVGTAIGYSALWIAKALLNVGHGRLITLEQDEQRASQAGQYFRRAGLEQIITQLPGDARLRIGDIRERIDFLFLDGGFENYFPCLLACQSQLAEGAMLVADNAGIGATEMADYLDLVRRSHQSHTEWFETDLAWNPRDAMEITVYNCEMRNSKSATSSNHE